jgi:tetratricopeptide (TPR) repeat protein
VKPEHPPILYHRACLLTRGGRLDEARAELDRALELDPELRKWAVEDADLAPLELEAG